MSIQRWSASSYRGMPAMEKNEDGQWVALDDHVAALAEMRVACLRSARHAVAVRLTQMGYDTEDTNPYLAAIDTLIHDGGQA